MMKRNTFIALMIGCLVVARITYATDKPLVNISINVGKSQFEVYEETDHTLVISNQSSEVLSLPNLPEVLNATKGNPEIARYLQFLRMQVTIGTNVIPIHQRWLTVPDRAKEIQTVELRPGECMSEHFSLTGGCNPSFYSLTNPGVYAVSVTLDTTKATSPKILKGVFVSAPTEFEIIPVPTFRAKKAEETKADYARERVVFYLKRIRGNTGVYFSNVYNIVKTDDGVPALIELMEVGDPGVRSEAESLLKQIHHPEDGHSEHPALPTSRQAWHEWWQKAGCKLSTADVWHNFDSHYQ